MEFERKFCWGWASLDHLNSLEWDKGFHYHPGGKWAVFLQVFQDHSWQWKNPFEFSGSRLWDGAGHAGSLLWSAQEWRGRKQAWAEGEVEQPGRPDKTSANHPERTEAHQCCFVLGPRAGPFSPSYLSLWLWAHEGGQTIGPTALYSWGRPWWDLGYLGYLVLPWRGIWVVHLHVHHRGHFVPWMMGYAMSLAFCSEFNCLMLSSLCG